jgi:enoyl-CoA hydratase/carnithine racemase
LTVKRQASYDARQMSDNRAHDVIPYAGRYEHVRMRRSDGVLELTLHSDGGPMIWNAGSHGELSTVFADVARDVENKVVIISGAGDAFCEVLDSPSFAGHTETPILWDVIQRETRAMIESHLAIPCPTIGVVNGPARVHAELALLCDIVLASETAVFQDKPHFPNGVVPGDGVHVIWPLLLGINRARYFLLTGQELSAGEALELGVVSEVLPPADLLARAHEHARELARRPPLALRYSRACITAELREQMARHLPLGLALEGLNTVQLAGRRLADEEG